MQARRRHFFESIWRRGKNVTVQLEMFILKETFYTRPNAGTTQALL